mgnify:CR=1 FL=1
MRPESLGTIEDFREKTTMRMNSNTHTVSPKSWRARLLGMFNLNDPRWGRGDDGKDENLHKHLVIRGCFDRLVAMSI